MAWEYAIILCMGNNLRRQKKSNEKSGLNFLTSGSIRKCPWEKKTYHDQLLWHMEESNDDRIKGKAKFYFVDWYDRLCSRKECCMASKGHKYEGK